MKKKIAFPILLCVINFTWINPSNAAQESHGFNFDSYCLDTTSNYDTLVIIDDGVTTTTHCTTSDGTDLITATVAVANSHSIGGNRNPGGMGYYLNELNGKSYDGNWWQLWMSGSFATINSFGCAYSNPKSFNNWELSDCGISSFIPADKVVYAWKFASGSETPQRRWTESVANSGGSRNSAPAIDVKTSTTEIKNPASIRTDSNGVSTLKLDLAKTYQNAKIQISFLDKKGKAIQLGTKKLNKNGDLTFKTKRKIQSGGKIIFKFGKKKVGEILIN